MPSTLVTDHQTDNYTEETIPEALTRDHANEEGMWGFVRVLSGELTMHTRGEEETTEVLSRRKPGIIEPGQLFRLETTGEVKFHIQYFREPT